MLNKSIPYKNIIMEIKSEDISKIPSPLLPEGFEFCLFEEGMEEDWARIETSVLEFDKEEEALTYFKEDYLPFLDELKKRCLFIKNSDGTAVATSTAWFSTSDAYGHQASLHWVAVSPQFQGLGLGKAIIQEASRIFLTTDPGEDVILHTQTWSAKAILQYLKNGYVFSKSKRMALAIHGGKDIKVLDNDYEEALEILKTCYPEDVMEGIRKNAR